MKFLRISMTILSQIAITKTQVNFNNAIHLDRKAIDQITRELIQYFIHDVVKFQRVMDWMCITVLHTSIRTSYINIHN